jgi:hypothetical protein
MHARSTFRLFALAVLAAASSLAACAAQVGTEGGSGAQTVAVSVSPGTSELAPGQSTQFAAVVTGTADVAVTWQVDEAGGGIVNATGLYTAPGATGTYHVRAVSHAAPDQSGVATVTVSAPPAGSVTISPKTARVTTGGSLTFTATVTGLSSSTVTWSVQEPSGCGSVSAAGVYTAPSTAGTCHVVATSTADSTRSDVATVTVNVPISVTVTPGTAAVDACRTVTFTASVAGTSDQVVAWSVTEGASGGSVSTGGVYTASSTAGTYHVVATAHASPAATASATVTVTDHILSITVNPGSASVSPSGTQQFTATVTTTCGAFAGSSP